jgi:hypothetical protein
MPDAIDRRFGASAIARIAALNKFLLRPQLLIRL